MLKNATCSAPSRLTSTTTTSSLLQPKGFLGNKSAASCNLQRSFLPLLQVNWLLYDDDHDSSGGSGREDHDGDNINEGDQDGGGL